MVWNEMVWRQSNLNSYKLYFYRIEISTGSACQTLVSSRQSPFVLSIFCNPLQEQNETVTLTSHFDVSSQQNCILFWHFKSLYFPCIRTKLALLWGSYLAFNSNIFLCVRIKHFCQETVSINWTSLPYIQGINFITWMGGHSLSLFPLWIDGNEMKLTLDPATV